MNNILIRSIIKTSWESFALILQLGGAQILEMKNFLLKTPHDVAVESGYHAEFSQIVEEFKSDPTLQELPNLLENISRLELQKKRTLLITDERCLQHAGFDNYHNIVKRKHHKDEQPENAERLMILIDENKGVLTKADEFTQNPSYVIKKEAKPVAIGDLYRVHDYNYLMRVIEIASKLKGTANKAIARYGKDFKF